ncbi:MAG: M23 family metallopeptidase [Chitinophagales bacterium]|nr:M23 family metallopeptidase [Chitinophagales bacterium]
MNFTLAPNSKMIHQKLLILQILIASVFCENVFAQAPKFRSPLDIPLLLSANFGEVRTDHFHTGYDIKTNGKTGYKVYAAADGYVSRIKVSAGGFGNVLYLIHPNGYMTVYAHLDRFNEAIAKFVKDQQYAKQSFEIELFPDAQKFAVKKGDMIGISGNSGNSGGPHLHFEIRDASGETFPLNPKDFIEVDDRIPPVLKALYVYPQGNYYNEAAEASGIVQSGGVYKLKSDSIIINHSSIGFGLEAEDKMNESESDLGLYKVEATLDGEIVFSMKLDRLNFLNNRYVNAHIDYKQWKETNTAIQKTFILPGDKNTIYASSENKGIINFKDTLTHRIRISASDASGNVSVLNFKIKYSGKEKKEPAPQKTEVKFSYNHINSFANDSVKLSIPMGVLYEDFYFHYNKTMSAAKFLSPIHSLQNSYTPLHSAADLAILPYPIKSNLKSKAAIVFRNENGKISSKTSQWDGNWITAKIRDLGDYSVMVDTMAPSIIPYGIKQNQLITRDDLRFTVSDNLTGVTNYKAMLDGKWILMAYDAKNDRMIVELDEAISTGEHSLKITVSDQVNNENTFNYKFKK